MWTQPAALLVIAEELLKGFIVRLFGGLYESGGLYREFEKPLLYKITESFRSCQNSSRQKLETFEFCD